MSTSVSIYLVSLAPEQSSTRLGRQRGIPNQSYSPGCLSWSLLLHLKRLNNCQRDPSLGSSDVVYRRVSKDSIEMDQNWWRLEVPDSRSQFQSTNTTDTWSSISAYLAQNHDQERSRQWLDDIDLSDSQRHLTLSRLIFWWHSKHSICVLQYSGSFKRGIKRKGAVITRSRAENMVDSNDDRMGTVSDSAWSTDIWDRSISREYHSERA